MNTVCHRFHIASVAIAALLFLLPAFCFAQKPEGKFTFSGRWINEDGAPVPDLGVNISYSNSEAHHVESLVTDADGKFSFTGNSNSKAIMVVIGREAKKKLSKEWYRPNSYNYLFKKLENGTWGPTPDPVDFVIKKKGDPIVLWHHGEHKIVLPEFGKPYGYDILKRELVAPHGAGEVTDVTFTVNRQRNNHRDWRNQMTVVWEGEGNGFQSIERPPYNHEYPYPTKVPTEGYHQERFWENGVSPEKGGAYWIRKDHSGTLEGKKAFTNPPAVLFRIRSKKGTDGTFTGLYGKMHKEFGVSLTRESVNDEHQPAILIDSLALNPEEGNTTLEFTRRKNAWPDLKRKHWSRRP